MNRLQIDKEDWDWTKAFFQTHKPHWRKRYFANFQATLEGFLAEVVITRLLNQPRPAINKYDKDAGWDVEWQGLKWDVKNTTVNRGEVYVGLRQMHKGADGYIFTRTEGCGDNGGGTLHLLGYAYEKQIEDWGFYYPKGAKTPNGVTVKTDDYVIPTNLLTPLAITKEGVHSV